MTYTRLELWLDTLIIAGWVMPVVVLLTVPVLFRKGQYLQALMALQKGNPLVFSAWFAHRAWDPSGPFWQGGCAGGVMLINVRCSEEVKHGCMFLFYNKGGPDYQRDVHHWGDLDDMIWSGLLFSQSLLCIVSLSGFFHVCIYT